MNEVRSTEATPRSDRLSFERLWVQAGVVLAAWLFLLILENFVVAAAFRVEFAGSWEMRTTRRLAIPLSLGVLLPAGFLAPLVARLARARRGAFAGVATVAGGIVAWGVSSGRHFANLAARVPFVGILAVVSGAAAAWIGPLLVGAASKRPRSFAVAGAFVGAAAWLADERVLPRLYPAFHWALLVLTLGGWALLALLLRPHPAEPTRAPGFVAITGLLAGVLAVLFGPSAATRLAASDNARIVLLEHAPLEGRAVWLASVLEPEPPDETNDSGSAAATPGELPRALDWTGRDIVLVTVDALRADHVSAYGYARPTTPNLDALAQAGTRFDAAYCPTPHTSYSVTSLMTGKYMRPLLALGLGEDSDTWAALLRRYGYRTSAFFPPAVFFIDGERFEAMHRHGLDFEYRKEEFATPSLRATQVAEYLARVPHDKPLFLWVHFFEPHEPYVAHAEHPFGSSDIDRYDSEIAAADDGIGAIVREVRAWRPGAVVIATADHGEEFGEHGGRYHGTSVYEEQVRVPLLVDGPGVVVGEASTVVQTIDLLPTVLSALGIPRPARLRGRDLGPALARKDHADAAPGLAFAETDEYTLLAKGDDRLVCARRAGACRLFDRARDPAETRDLSSEKPQEARDLRRELRALAGEHGRFEHGAEAAWPEALRRGIAGDADAAPDVAALLDDARAAIRAKAGEVSFDLHVPDVAPAMRRELDEGGDGGDDEVRKWCALALVRMGELPSALAEGLLHDADVRWRRPAALAFAERGDRRAATDLAAWWGDRAGIDYVRATEIVRALGKLGDRVGVPVLVRSLDDVRMRPFVADALAEIGDPSARSSLAAVLAAEAQVTSRAHEARALVKFGGASWAGKEAAHVETKLDVTRVLTATATVPGSPLRLVVLAAGDAPCRVSIDGAPAGEPSEAVAAPIFDVPAGASQQKTLTVTVDDDAGIEALFLIRAPSPADAGLPEATPTKDGN